MKFKIDAIYEVVLPMMEKLGIEDTAANRLAALIKLRYELKEDRARASELSLSIVAISCEISRLNTVVYYENLPK